MNRNATCFLNYLKFLYKCPHFLHFSEDATFQFYTMISFYSPFMYVDFLCILGAVLFAVSYLSTPYGFDIIILHWLLSDKNSGISLAWLPGVYGCSGCWDSK